tara:strand:+ start:7978 stop:8115 length:138 start_codon:yes stop_codon:yes gene_type:complete
MEYLDEYVNVRMTPSDKQKLKEVASNNKLSVSAYCRVRLVKGIND